MKPSGEPPPVRLVIELTGDREPIEGHVLEPEALVTSFRGWLSLAALIEAARQGPSETT